MKVRYLVEWNTPHSYVRQGAVCEMTPAAAKPLIDGNIVVAVVEPKPEPKPPVKRGK